MQTLKNTHGDIDHPYACSIILLQIIHSACSAEHGGDVLRPVLFLACEIERERAAHPDFLLWCVRAPNISRKSFFVYDRCLDGGNCRRDRKGDWFRWRSDITDFWTLQFWGLAVSREGSYNIYIYIYILQLEWLKSQILSQKLSIPFLLCLLLIHLLFYFLQQ